MVDEIEVPSDQSLFAGVQSVLQPPPVDPDPVNQKRKFMILGGIGLVVVILLVLVYGGGHKKRVVVTQEPTPSATPLSAQTEMQQETKKIQDEVTSVNPDDVLVLPPQVDMTVEF